MPHFAGLFDDRVVLVGTDFSKEPYSESELDQAELAYVRYAVKKRRLEFVAGRLLAREAMMALGLAPQAVLADLQGAPQWPLGVVGSISHAENFCLVAMARSQVLRSIGLDLETTEPIHEDAWDRIFTSSERTSLDRLPEAERSLASKVIFSAKESIYKAQYALSGAYCDFQDVSISLDEERASWRAEFHVSVASLFGPGDVITGSFIQAPGWIATGLALPADWTPTNAP